MRSISSPRKSRSQAVPSQGGARVSQLEAHRGEATITVEARKLSLSVESAHVPYYQEFPTGLAIKGPISLGRLPTQTQACCGIGVDLGASNATSNLKSYTKLQDGGTQQLDD